MDKTPLLHAITLLLLNSCCVKRTDCAVDHTNQKNTIQHQKNQDNHVHRFQQSSDSTAWNRYKDKYGKIYSLDEEEFRYQIFHQNLQHISAHNAAFRNGTASFELGVNEFSDMDPDEFTRTMNGCVQPSPHIEEDDNDDVYYGVGTPPLIGSIPDTVDWRKEGYVTSVKNQGRCGSCWAFSTTGSVEGQHFRATGKLVSLSEQQLLDCSRGSCKGGWVNSAFKYIKQSKGIDTEKCYAYKHKKFQCHYNTTCIGSTLSGIHKIHHGNETALKEAVSTVGPVSIIIDASHRKFQHYKRGIYDDPACSSKKLDHAVLVVGYGSQNGTNFWIVKNSWGKHWGEAGYIKMSRDKHNQCGIASSASYPVV